MADSTNAAPLGAKPNITPAGNLSGGATNTAAPTTPSGVNDFSYPAEDKAATGVNTTSAVSAAVITPANTKAKEDGSLADLAKKLSTWKDDFMKKPDEKPGSTSNEVAAAPIEPADEVPPTPPIEPVAPVENKPAASEMSPISSVSNPAEEDAQKSKDKLVKVTTDSTTGDLSGADKDKSQSAINAAIAEPTKPVASVSPATTVASPLPASTATTPKTTFPSVTGKPTAASSAKPAVSNGKFPYTIEQLLQMVVDRNASDLHITFGYPVMIRIDSELMPVSSDIVTEKIAEDLVMPILPEAKRELLEVNREVDLAYSFKESARFRINAYYEKGHVAAALRLIPNRIRTIDELKLPGSYHQLANLPQGLVLVTGPTGHGKSTTLAAIIQEINENQAKHIVTIEDPIEYVYPPGKSLVDQREMHEDTHSWEIALRSALRQDPDVVLVGEMRDFETIASAITIAETGHLVLATLHTNSAAQTVDRLIDVFPEHQQAQVRVQISNILEAVIAQRLIPVKGGGRRAVSEVMLCTPAIRSLIREGKSHQIDNVIRTSMDVGMKSLEHSLVDLIREGVITVEEAEANSVHPEEIGRLMK